MDALIRPETRLLDEIEQLRTALEDALAENARLAESQIALSGRLTQHARDFSSVRAGHGNRKPRAGADQALDAAPAGQSQTEEELRVALEELEMVVEELEASNTSLRDVNRDLDRRVAERTRDLARVNEVLRASEASFRAIANLTPDLLMQFGRGGDLAWCNDRWYGYTGQWQDGPLGLGWLSPIHPAERADVAAAWQVAVANGSDFTRDVRLRSHDGTYRWFLVRLEATRDERGGISGWYGAVTETHEQRHAMEALRASEARFRTLIEGVPQLIWRSRHEGSWTWASPQWASFTGQSVENSAGRGWERALHPDDRPKASEAWAATQGRNPLDFEARIFNAGEGRYRHFRIRATPVRAQGGRVLEWLGTATDIDDLIQFQSRQQVLVAELQHRTRNLMAVVSSVVTKTLESSTSLDDFESRITERLGALARVQQLLARRAEGVRVTLDDVLQAELAAHAAVDAHGNGRQVSLSGPAGIGLRSATVQTFALALHELTTNALKYGALATPDGHLDVRWHLENAEGQQRLVVEWLESGVTTLPYAGAPPRGGGYGRQLIEEALPYQLAARTTYGFGADGLRCIIDVPLC